MRFLPMFLLAAVLAMAAPDDEIRAAEKSWRQALVARDVGALEKLYTADLIYAHSTGKVESKKEYLDRLASGHWRDSAPLVRGINVEDGRLVHPALQNPGP